MSEISEYERLIRGVAAQAAGIMRTGGWCKGSMRSGTAVCLVGAVVDTGCPRDIETAIYNRVRALIKTDKVVAWNDGNGRTVGEVLGVLDRVAAGEGAP